MSVENIVETGQRALANRGGVSRKLLAQKARARVSKQPCGEALESDFPSADNARRCTSGEAPRQSRDSRRRVAQQMLGLGNIQPNPNTVIATIVSLVVR